MSQMVYKYPLELTDTQQIEMPDGARLLSVKNQQGTLCLWALVDPHAPMVKRTIYVLGTGHTRNDEVSAELFVGTVLMGWLVWHVFEGLA